MMLDGIREAVRGKKIAIAGFGLEGQSTFRFLRQEFGNIPLAVADRDPGISFRTDIDLSSPEIKLFTGNDYLENLDGYDILFKSPGIAIPPSFSRKNPSTRITSQTDMVLGEFHRQVIGITGTKGKSTTSSLICHILQSSGKQSILIGNIGIPPFDSLHLIGPDTLIVFELSSHQLENTSQSPHIAVLLNLFPEHLDRYPSVREYFRAKWKIFLNQQAGDVLILNEGVDPEHLPGPPFPAKGRILRFGMQGSSGHDGCFMSGDNVIIRTEGSEEVCCVLEENLLLKGRHNRMNMMAAILACRECGISSTRIMEGIRTFHGLEHRLEYVGCFGGIDFYNDSIATIPEATMEAVRTIKNIDTLILGGYDRLLDYTELMDFLMASDIRNLIFMGKAGERMMRIAETHQGHHRHRLFFAANLSEAFLIIQRETRPGAACLLSPAAASYDMYKNFEERGRMFKKMARNL